MKLKESEQQRYFLQMISYPFITFQLFETDTSCRVQKSKVW